MTVVQAEAHEASLVVLDVALGMLQTSDGNTTRLRPKTLRVLQHLLTHAGRTVTREDLLDTIWPDQDVGDDVVTQSIREIRRALGDAADRLQTLPRLGYRLDAAAPIALGALPKAKAPEPATAQAPPAQRRLPVIGATALVCLLAFAAAFAVTPRPGPFSDLPRERQQSLRLYQQALIASRNPVQPDNVRAELALLDQAIAADPNFIAPYLEMSGVYLNLRIDGQSTDRPGDLAKARTLLEKAAAVLAAQERVDPVIDAAVHFERGRLLESENKPAEALAEFAKAVEGAPNIPSFQGFLGIARLREGQPELSLAPLRRAIALAPVPDDITVLGWQYALGEAQLLSGDGDLGAAALRLSLTSNKTALVFINVRRLTLAAALALAGQVEDAQQITRAVLADAPAWRIGAFRKGGLSRAPAYLARRDPLLRGLALAGLPE